jgi:ADP-heptose:LPS heptosyltransferase
MYIVCFQALGDNLITLSLLKQIHSKIKLLGTQNTANIIRLLHLESHFELSIVFDNIPAFYDIRQRGLIKAIKDLYRFIVFIRKNKIAELVFEKKDFRSKIIIFLTGVKAYFPDRLSQNVYHNRQKLTENIYDQFIDLNKYRLKLNNPKKILINPTTRVESKNIKNNHLHFIIDELNNNGYEIYFIDVDKKYSRYEKKVHHYLTNTSLQDVKKLILDSDLYIGGDSFLIHLAYYLKRPYFMIFYKNNDTFIPPNIENDFYMKEHKNLDFYIELKQKFRNIGLIY